MANAQLVTYIKTQYQKGIAKDAVLKALTDVGWGADDIAAAFAEVETPAQPSPTTTAAPTATPQQASPVASAFSSPAPTENPASSANMSFRINEIMSSDASSSPKTTNASGKGKGAMIAAIILGALFLAAASFAGYLFMQNSSATEDSETSQQKIEGLSGQINLLTQEKTDLTAKLSAAVKEKEDIAASLQLFATASPFGSTTDSQVNLKGILSGGDNRPFALTTAQGITFFVKNWKDKSIDAAIRPLLGSNVALGVLHTPGTRDISVVDVNGSPIAVATSTASSTPR